MKISSLTVTLTEKCNFNCQYCYQVTKGQKTLPSATLTKALEFFYPRFSDDCFVNFYGGEPLLEFAKIKKTVEILNRKQNRERKKIKFTFTTNGSLINEEILEFLSQHHFHVMVSFDGPLQNQTRQKDSQDTVEKNIKKLLSYPDITLDTNSVFSPHTINQFNSTMLYLQDLGVTNIRYSLDTVSPWSQGDRQCLQEQIRILKDKAWQEYCRSGHIPFVRLRPGVKNGIFWCAAGADRFTLAPTGELWGCFLFQDHFRGKEEQREYKKYCFGKLDEFMANCDEIYQKILDNYRPLRQDYFWKPGQFCKDCEELEYCRVCPIDSAFSGGVMGRVPEWICEINRIVGKEIRSFHKQIEASSKHKLNKRRSA